MALRFRVGYQFQDYNGEISETGLTVADVSSVAALDTFVLGQENIFQALSDAPIVSALAYAKRSPEVNKPVTGLGSIYKRLLILCTNGPRYGSLIIPAPRADLDYETTGPLAGIKVAPGPSSTAILIDTLVELLGATLLADGTPFPIGEWQAALISDP